MQVDSPAVQAPRDGGKIHGSQNGSGAGTPSDGTPAAGAKPKKSKWAEDDSEEEGGGAAAPQPAQAPPGKAKSKWAEDSPSPEAPGAAAPEPGAKMADDVLSKAAGQVRRGSARPSAPLPCPLPCPTATRARALGFAARGAGVSAGGAGGWRSAAMSTTSGDKHS